MVFGVEIDRYIEGIYQMNASDQFYVNKNAQYFTGERRDFIDQLSEDASRAILEIGCGDGATGAYAKRTRKCGRYAGVELFPDAAQIAAQVLDEVYIADVENFDFGILDRKYDAFVASEVLEHLVDPWATLKKVRERLTPGARVFASSPNVAHISTIKMLLRGRWDLESAGRMDRTHLRWFTPDSYAQMFRDCGYKVISVEPLAKARVKTRIANMLTAHRLSHLFVSQIVVVAEA
jgi:SAM-dependent methyltransferase